jgi:hypothetical protein
MKIIRTLLAWIIGVGGLIYFMPFAGGLDYSEGSGAGTKLLIYIFIWGGLTVGLILWQLWEGDIDSSDIESGIKTNAMIYNKCPSCRKKLPSRLTKRCPFCTSIIKY